MRTRDENKEILVKSKAIEMLVTEGFDGFSMQKLAKAAKVSPATLYIYYKDKEDLILQLGIEEGKRMADATMSHFNPEMGFAEGMRVQWENRAKYQLENPMAAQFFEQLKHSPYRDKVHEAIKDNFKEIMGLFIKTAVKNGVIKSMPIEVFWSVAYAPLYNLIRFHQEGRSMGGRRFEWTDDYMYQALELVLKAFKP